MSRKFEAIDLMKLKALGSANGWNEFLDDCVLKLDIERLAKVRYQIAAGMDDLAKKKMNTEEMNLFFIRLNRSLENTARQIVRKRNPLPHDDPLEAANWSSEYLEAKRKRDRELAAFLRKSAY